MTELIIEHDGTVRRPNDQEKGVIYGKLIKESKNHQAEILSEIFQGQNPELTEREAQLYEILKTEAKSHPDNQIRSLNQIAGSRAQLAYKLARKGLIKKVAEMHGRYGALWEVRDIPYTVVRKEVKLEKKIISPVISVKGITPKQIEAKLEEVEARIMELGTEIEKLIRTKQQLEKEKEELQIALEVITRLAKE